MEFTVFSPTAGCPGRPAPDGPDTTGRPPASRALPSDGACRALRHTASTITDDVLDLLYEALARATGRRCVDGAAPGEVRA
jgi:hypothetical protein